MTACASSPPVTKLLPLRPAGRLGSQRVTLPTVGGAFVRKWPK
jgi:hypothetical protein